MTFTGFNFRSTLAGGTGFTGDGPNDVWAGATSSSYLAVGSGGTGYGWVAATGSLQNFTATGLDMRLAGSAFLNGSPTYRIDVPNGTYNVRLAIGGGGAAGDRAVRIKVGTGSTAGVDYLDVVATSVSNVQEGDAAGFTWSNAAWPGSNVTIQVVVTNGWFQLPGVTSIGGSQIRHFAYEPVSSGATLAGQAATTGQGSVTVGIAGGATLTGQAGVTSQGNITLAIAGGKTLAGQAATAGQGSLGIGAVPVSVAITGQTVTAVEGSLGAGSSLYRGFNFRSTQAFSLFEGAGNSYAGGEVTYSAGLGYGWVGSTPVFSNGVGTNDPRLRGSFFQNSGGARYFRVDVPNGVYNIRAAVGSTGGAPGAAYLRVQVGAGGVAGTDLIDIGSGASQTTSQSGDATNNIWNNTDWPANNAPLQVTVTQGCFLLQRSTAQAALARHFAYSLVNSGGATLSGQSLTTAQGAIGFSAPVSKAITGQAMTAGRGTISAGAQLGVTLTGQQVAVNQSGPVSSYIDFGSSGQQVAVNQSGPVQTFMDMSANGLGMTAGEGAVGYGVPASGTISGQGATSGQGSIGVRVSPVLLGQGMAAQATYVSGLPRHDISYEISHGFDGGAFDPGGFYSSNNPSSSVQQGAVNISSNVPALRSDTMVAGQGTLTYVTTYSVITDALTLGQGAAVSEISQDIGGQMVNTQQGGDLYVFFPDFFDGTVEDVYVPPEENILYVPEDFSDMLVA